MSLVFVSYSRKDSEFVLELAQRLKQYKVPIWVDQLNIPAGKRWDVAVETALLASTHMLLIMSHNSVESENVLDELGVALEEKKTIVPIRIDDSRPPYRIRRLQYTDYQVGSETSSTAFLNLLDLLPQQIDVNESQTLVHHSVDEAANENESLSVEAAPKGQNVDEPIIFVTEETRSSNRIPAELVFNHDKIRWSVTKDEIIIGRDNNCDITIVDRRISKQHVCIRYEQSFYTIEDLNSSNGTRLNGKKIESDRKMILKNNDVLKIASDIEIKFIQHYYDYYPPNPPDPLDETVPDPAIRMQDEIIDVPDEPPLAEEADTIMTRIIRSIRNFFR